MLLEIGSCQYTSTYKRLKKQHNETVHGVKQPGPGADPHLSAEVMKVYGYTSTHPLGLSGLL